jgi:hypothetical protein
MLTPTNNFTPKNAKNIVCEKCDFKCCKNSDMERHKMTLKHKRLINTNAGLIKNADRNFVCVCGKKYRHLPSLYKHKKFCEKIDILFDDEVDAVKFLQMENKEIIDLFKNQMKENTEMYKQFMNNVTIQNQTISELANKVGSNNTIHTNSHNKTFNLQFFLNETCKDAINITDFVNSIKIQLSDLETTGKLGYVKGISNIFLKNLSGLHTHERPIHCSDLKREVLYIKNDDQWIKEDEEKYILQKAIKEVANKNIKQIPEWVKTNPNCYDSESKKNDQYLKIVSNSMSGSSKEEQANNINSIIKNLAKEVLIDKDKTTISTISAKI